MNRQEKIDKLVDYMMAMDYGDTITHGEISRIIQECERTVSYYGIVNSAKRKLSNLSHMVENMRGEGYRVAYPDDYVNHAVKNTITGARYIDKGAKIMRVAPTKDMTQEGITTYNLVNDKMRILQATMSGAKVEIKMLSGRREHPLAQK